MKSYIHIILILETFLFLSFQSCSNKKPKGEGDERIVGLWKSVERIDSSINDSLEIDSVPNNEVLISKNTNGYEFFSDGSCDNKAGYFVEDPTNTGNEVYLGANTNYSVKNDTLRIFNLATGLWDSYKLSRIEKDTLEFQYDNNKFECFARIEKNLDNQPTFDQIVLSTTGCNGTCPINDILIGKDGLFLYNGTKYNVNNGLYKADLDTSYFSQIERAFQIANIDKMQESYLLPVTDLQTVEVLFIKDGRIYKNISDKGGCSPTEFQWAYNALQLIKQQTMLNKYKPKNDFLKSETLSISKGKERLYLNKAETVYLKYLLSEAKEIKLPFVKMYIFNVTASSGQIITVASDGRYYTIGNKTYDIGYNFIKTLQKRFIAKEE